MDLIAAEERLTTFRQALERVSGLAHARLPESLHGPLERATALVRHGHVFPDEHGKHAQVLSSDSTHWYPVNGHCTCMDATKAPQGLCKHQLAFGLYRRAAELLASGACGVSAPTAAAALRGAPASVNVRLCIEGRECQWTLRDVDETRLAERLAALLARFPQAEAAPPAPPAGAAQPTPEGWCLVHHVHMERQSNQRGSWWSHKTPDGWCKGK